MTKINNTVELTRVNINLPTKLVEKVKEYAASLGINITNAYIILLGQAINQYDMITNLPQLFTLYNELKKLQDNGEIDLNTY